MVDAGVVLLCLSAARGGGVEGWRSSKGGGSIPGPGRLDNDGW